MKQRDNLSKKTGTEMKGDHFVYLSVWVHSFPNSLHIIHFINFDLNWFQGLPREPALGRVLPNPGARTWGRRSAPTVGP